MNIYSTDEINLSKKYSKIIGKNFILDLISYIQSTISLEKIKRISIDVSMDKNLICYSLDNFVANFPSDTNYYQISIRTSLNNEGSLNCIITKRKILISFNNEDMSLVQSNEYVEHLNSYIKNLFKKHTQSNKQNSRAEECINNAEKEKWYKSSVFWTALGSIATIIAFIVSVLMNIFFN